MKEKCGLAFNLGTRKSLLTFTVFLVGATLFFSNTGIVYSIEQNSISGIGYGNNGDRFGSFISCSGTDSVQYFEGSAIHFETLPIDNSALGKNSETSLGTWTIDFVGDNSQSPTRISGDISESMVENNTYTLVGKETFDNVCNDMGNTITLKGECGENTRIWFSDSNDAKVGSLAPPNGDMLYYLTGSKVDCV